MFCPKCGSEVKEGTAFCGRCGAPVGEAQTGASGAAGQPSMAGRAAGSAAPRAGGSKVGIVAVAVVVVLVLVVGFATNWFGLGGVQPKDAVDVPAAGQQAADGQGGASADGSQDGATGDGQVGADGSALEESGEDDATSAVEAYSWAELSQISSEIAAAGSEEAAIEVAKKYNLCLPDDTLDGTQVKSVTLSDGTETYVQIVGFAHDDKTDGGKAGITFIFGDCIGEASMNADGTNAGGWNASELRASLNSQTAALLPEDLATVVVPVDKLTNNVGETQDISSVTVTSDRLWLFSKAELCGEDAGSGWRTKAQASVSCAEGSQYQLFRNTNVSRLGEEAILVKNREGEPNYWWVRSPNLSDSFRFFCADPDGSLRGVGDLADYSHGVVPGFCI